MDPTQVVVWDYAAILEEFHLRGPSRGETLKVWLVVDHPRWGGFDVQRVGEVDHFSSATGVWRLKSLQHFPGGDVAGYESESGIEASLDWGKAADAPPEILVDPPLRISDGTDPIADPRPCFITVQRVDRRVRDVPGRPDASVDVYRIEGVVR